MKTYLIVSEKSWHERLYKHASDRFPDSQWEFIQKKEDFNQEQLNKLKPEKIFIPHWSYLIPASIYQQFECIVFHMTDLPFGRGGSPLQNLIVRGKTKTKISALQVQKGKVTEFKRRKPEDGKISDLSEVYKLYDYIRMLDCTGYPNAYLETEFFRFEFSRASLKSEKEIIADVRIIKK